MFKRPSVKFPNNFRLIDSYRKKPTHTSFLRHRLRQWRREITDSKYNVPASLIIISLDHDMKESHFNLKRTLLLIPDVPNHADQMSDKNVYQICTLILAYLDRYYNLGLIYYLRMVLPRGLKL